MRSEVQALWRVLRKQKCLEDSAISLSSPGFDQSYNASNPTEAGFERYAIAAIDMREEVKKALVACILAVEDDDRRICTDYNGQKQRVERLRVVAERSVEEIAGILGISVRTVKRRLDDSVTEKAYGSPFERRYYETCMLSVDAQIEEYIASSYRHWQKVSGVDCEEAEQMILVHKQRAGECRKRQKEELKVIRKEIVGLDDTERVIVEDRLIGGMEWTEVEKEVCFSHSHAKRLYSQAVRKMSHVSA